MKLTRHAYITRGEKVRDFFIGFGIWLLLNLVLGIGVPFVLGPALGDFKPTGLAGDILDWVAIALACLPWLLNLIALIYFGLTRYWIALGILGGFGLAFVVVICGFLFVAVLCFSGNMRYQ